MLAVHFGAGNIGRGFIGALLCDAGYHTTFIDVNKEIIDEINEKKQYRVILADQNQEEIVVDNISGINSIEEPQQVADTIARADIVTAAVGPTVLPIIAKNIAEGLLKRVETTTKPINIIACENMVGGSSLLREKILELLPEEKRVLIDEIAGFPNSAVDRIVPNQTNEQLLTVAVEPYYEWAVEKPAFKGEVPKINGGVTYVEDLKPYIERKLYTVNAGHAAAAYLGNMYGYQKIEEAVQDDRVQTIINRALKETGDVLITLYHFDKTEHDHYRNKIIGRFTNPYLSDEVTRVGGRGPIRKLGANDRLIGPARQYVEQFQHAPENLSKVIAAALKYENREDPEAVTLQEMIKEKGYQRTLEEITGLAADHPVITTVLKHL
ncbi:mannitol-1-phosphate 5-dehydrogenase [Gracilibacillus boraciitolerans JCM 21714]|uniref:Mannitol-1-phosphate 5-dehydrogenase n=1 Tax=Gracilibacillus boraciitolerans JCM 21714 TaxID=1298598 RepID=W4VF90_9BACI|nr:mannitol-1-phosphate 5-dehydrogenase [Gracilibacillus boraciitolerans]GAE92070.1 mannitol-1-phosphate 5-dehydrogenase [Gracilibacillus boraciitolerans JCM 21714]